MNELISTKLLEKYSMLFKTVSKFAHDESNEMTFNYYPESLGLQGHTYIKFDLFINKGLITAIKNGRGFYKVIINGKVYDKLNKGEDIAIKVFNVLMDSYKTRYSEEYIKTMGMSQEQFKASQNISEIVLKQRLGTYERLLKILENQK